MPFIYINKRFDIVNQKTKGTKIINYKYSYQIYYFRKKKFLTSNRETYAHYIKIG